MSIKQKAINGVKWTTISSAINALVHLLQLMILARYLTPQDFGLMAILMVVIGFSQIFVDFGLSKAIIYKKNVTDSQLSTLYWLNIILSFMIFSFILLSSSFIADFYNEKRLDTLIIVISYSLIIQAFGQQFRTLFQKELEFSVLAKIDISAAVISLISSILLAVNGYGIYALIYPVLIMTTIKSVFLVYKGVAHHKPRLIFNLTDVKEFLSFGSYVIGNGMVSTVATQIDVIIIGKLLGTEALGLYSIAKGLIQKPLELINPIIAKVAFPTMSKINNDINYVKKIYLKIINYIASLSIPIYMASYILAPEIITIFLGEKWLEITLIFQILAIWALIRSVGSAVGSLVMASGKPQYEMYWNIGVMIFMSIVVYISSFWGILGVALGSVISVVILYIPKWYFLVKKLCNATLKEYFLSTFSPLVISLFIGIIIHLLLTLYNGGFYYKILFTLIFGSILLWFLNKKYNRDFYNMIIALIEKNKV